MLLCFAIINQDFRFSKLFMVCFICTLILNAYNIFTRKVKWRKREILELAAFPVNENTNGFSERPKPVGKKDFKHNEILEFAHFL